MARSILELYPEGAASTTDVDADEQLPFVSLPCRSDTLLAFKTEDSQGGGGGQIRAKCDVVMLGSDIVTALSAQLLALQGVRVLVLSESSFGAAQDFLFTATSLALLDSAPIRFLSLRRLGNAAAKLVRYAPHRILRVPVAYSRIRDGGYLRRRPAHSLLTNRTLISDELRLTHEALLGAKLEGARCINHAIPLFCESSSESGTYTIGFRDQLTEKPYEVECGCVVVASTGRIPGSRLHSGATGDSTLYLKGEGPSATAMCLMFNGQGSGQIPHNHSTGGALEVVRYSDGCSAVLRVSEDGTCTAFFPTESEPHRLPAGVLEVLIERFGEVVSVVRTGPVAAVKGPLFDVKGGIIRIGPAGACQAVDSAEQISRLVVDAGGVASHARVRVDDCRNPSILPPLRASSGTAREQFRSAARRQGVSEAQIAVCERRWGDRVKYIPLYPDGLGTVVPTVLTGEVLLARYCEGATTPEDLVHSSLALTTYSSWEEGGRAGALRTMSDLLERRFG